MTFSATKLDSRALIHVSGEDAEHFLQNLITFDLALLAERSAGFGALLTPQGKILFDFFVVPLPEDSGEDGYLLDIHRDGAKAFLQRLSMYKLRAKVDVADRSDDLFVLALYGDADRSGLDDLPGHVVADPRHKEMGYRAYLPDIGEGVAVSDRDLIDAGLDRYDALRVKICVPQAPEDYTWGDAFPHDANFDQFSAIGFHKGCFVGQEVVSRMKHRGTARRRIVQASAVSPLPPGGTDLTVDGKLIGTLGSVSEHLGIAAVRIDKAKAAAETGLPVMADGIEVNLGLPDWVSFGWDGSSK